MDLFLCFVFVFDVTVLSVPCSLVVTCWVRADILTMLCVMFFGVVFLVFLSLSNMVSWVRCCTCT